MSFPKEVLSLTLEEVQELHEATGCSFFGCEDDEHTVITRTTMLYGKYLYTTKKFKDNFPKLSLEKYNKIIYTPAVEEVGLS